MPSKELRIEVPGSGAISARRDGPATPAWTFVYAPGAGANLDDPFGAHLARTLASAGAACVRFQFPYMEAGKRSPDRPAVLEAAWRAVIDAVRPKSGKLAVGGRSMGGRIASMVLADGAKADALALFAYPLHPPGKPQQRRVEHLPSIRQRTLFVSGTNDAFGSPDELAAAASLAKRSKLHLLDGADHGFAVRKSAGRTKTEVFEEAAQALVRWLP